MNPTVADLVAELPPFLRAIRARFQQGGSLVSILLVLLGMAAVVIVVAWLGNRQHHTARGRARNDPQKLFRDVVEKLPLSARQRQFLFAVVKDARLKHPCVILLAPALFDRYVEQWGRRFERAGKRPRTDQASSLVSRVRAVLFPTPERTSKDVTAVA